MMPAQNICAVPATSNGHAGTPFGTPAARFDVIAAVKTVYRLWASRRAVLRVKELDDRMLADIGLTRDDVREALAQPYWSDPSSSLRATTLQRTSRAHGGPLLHLVR
ncbi:MAG: DUF1127 domain-containing protein [Pseudomonadota bacterium]